MACNMGEVATVAAWLDSGNHPDDATTFGGTLLVAAAERGGPDMSATAPSAHACYASGPSGVLARLFPGPRTLLGPKLPRELFAHVLSFWRSARALDEDRAFDRVRARYLPRPYGRWYSYESPPGVVQLPPFLFQ